jgi:hypothetical protein
MSATLTYEGQQEMLDLFISTVTNAAIKVRLYTAKTGTGKNTALADFTEATFSGYTSGGYVSTFAAGSVDANDKWARVGSTVTPTHNGGGTSNTVLGYYVVDTANGKCLFYEAFSAPISMSANGNAIPITPTWYMGDASTPL